MGKDLTDEQIHSMKEAFVFFDTDDDGKIAPSELGILMRSLGRNPTQSQLKSIVAEEKLTTSFDFKRFLELMEKHMKPEPFDRQLRLSFTSPPTQRPAPQRSSASSEDLNPLHLRHFHPHLLVDRHIIAPNHLLVGRRARTRGGTGRGLEGRKRRGGR
ncbi:Probable calcium-binding protein CML13 [Linum perenne]